MLTVKQLENMRRMEMGETKKETLTDIRTISIDAGGPLEMRMESYLEQIKNPYLFLWEDTPVRLRFNSNGGSLEGAVKEFFISLKKS